MDDGLARETFHGRIGYYDRHFVFHMETRAQKEGPDYVVLGGVTLSMATENRKYDITYVICSKTFQNAVYIDVSIEDSFDFTTEAFRN